MSNEKIRAIIGLGNPGDRFIKTRHNIGFRVIDACVDRYNGHWEAKGNFFHAQIVLNDHEIICIKPQTFMNNSGEVIPFLEKKGIKPTEIIVVHDELEKSFGKLQVRLGGSARGHNGLKSIIERIGQDFWRLRIGIDRPERNEDVSDYVLARFTEKEDEISSIIEQSVDLLSETISG